MPTGVNASSLSAPVVNPLHACGTAHFGAVGQRWGEQQCRRRPEVCTDFLTAEGIPESWEQPQKPVVTVWIRTPRPWKQRPSAKTLEFTAMMIRFQSEASQRDRCGSVFVSRVFPLIKVLDRGSRRRIGFCFCLDPARTGRSQKRSLPRTGLEKALNVPSHLLQVRLWYYSR